ncbi:MAG: energy transducer TonB family protein [Pseudomonadota bacterium]
MAYGVCFFFLDAWNWRRTPFPAALGVSLLVHALALSLLPGFSKTAQPAFRPLNAMLRPPPAPALAPPETPRAVAPQVVSKRTRKPAPETLLAAKRREEGGRRAPPAAAPALPPRSDFAQDAPSAAVPAPSDDAPAQGGAKDAPAAAGARAQPEAAALAAYGEVLAEAIGRQQRYPRIALMRRWQGTTVLDLAVDGEGRLLDVRIVRSSGHEVLDQSAVEMARAAIPLPRPPAPLVAPGLSLHVPVVFKLVQ